MMTSLLNDKEEHKSASARVSLMGTLSFTDSSAKKIQDKQKVFWLTRESCWSPVIYTRAAEVSPLWLLCSKRPFASDSTRATLQHLNELWKAIQSCNSKTAGVDTEDSSCSRRSVCLWRILQPHSDQSKLTWCRSVDSSLDRSVHSVCLLLCAADEQNKTPRI